MFKMVSSSFLLRTAQRQSGTPNAFDPWGRRDPYQLYSLPNDGQGKKLTTPFSLGFPGEPTDGSSSGLGGDKFDRVNSNLPHPYAENGDPVAKNADPDDPFLANEGDRPERTEYGTGGYGQQFTSDDSPLSRNTDVFDGSVQLDRNPNGPQGDIGGKARARAEIIHKESI